MSYIVRLFQFLGLMEQTNCRSQKRQTTIEDMTMKNKTRKSNDNQLSHDGVKGNIFISFRIACKVKFILRTKNEAFHVGSNLQKMCPKLS